jgi:magnesium transporter
VVSFQFDELRSLNHISERIGSSGSVIRSHSADYLASAMLDAVIDTYFPVLESLGEKLEDLEDAIMENPSREVIKDIHNTRRQLLIARRNIWPMREVLNALLRDASHNFSNEVRLHLRDCYDHVVELIDLTETYRELGADLMDVYLSSISNRMNEVMKVLTIIATVFAPPTLIAAIYGMNFNSSISPYNMPETNSYYGYPIVLMVMLLGSLSVLAFLWWKGWLGVMAKRSMKE